MSSLSARLLLSVSLLLLVFFGATIAVLDIAFRQAGEQAQRHILDGHLMSLLAAAEPGADNELRLPPDLPEPRFGNPRSGLYGELRDAQGRVVWQSRSTVGLDLPWPGAPATGENHYAEIALDGGAELAAVSLAVDWELPDGDSDRYTFSVAESLDEYYAQLGTFRRQLFGWFIAVALVMLFSISLAMRGVLRPLRQIEREIGEIEDGHRQELSENFPSELAGVAANMNMLIGSERARSERYRNTLDNLAHSLKTPLAAIRSVTAEQPASKLARRVEAQVRRMNDIVRYQLRKPSSGMRGFGMTAVDVGKELGRLTESLGKVYQEKNPAIGLEIADGAAFRGERGDFLELAGNLLDNACKWCRSKVELSVRPLAGGAGLQLVVSDDGAGIAPEAAEFLLERGTRLDESAPGHGIGLAVVKDIAASYGGDVRIGRSDAGGAEVTVTLPSV